MTPEETVTHLLFTQHLVANPGAKWKNLPSDARLQAGHEYFRRKEQSKRAEREAMEAVERSLWQNIKETSPEMADPR